MQDLLTKINEVTTRITELQKKRADLEASANAHEKAAREDRLAMTECKKEIGELTAVLQHSQVQHGVQSAQVAAQKAQADAELAKKDQEATAARLLEKEQSLEAKMKELDALLAKAKAPEA